MNDSTLIPLTTRPGASLRLLRTGAQGLKRSAAYPRKFAQFLVNRHLTFVDTWLPCCIADFLLSCLDRSIERVFATLLPFNPAELIHANPARSWRSGRRISQSQAHEAVHSRGVRHCVSGMSCPHYAWWIEKHITSYKEAIYKACKII